MSIAVGSSYFGKVHRFEGQHIGTKFVVIGFPLFPVESTFITTSKDGPDMGFEIELNSASMGSVYGRGISLAGAAYCILAAKIFDDGGGYVIPAFILGALCLYLFFGYGRPGSREKQHRTALGKCLGINAYPKWLKHRTANNLLGELQKKYKPMKPSAIGSWKEHILSGAVAPPHLDILLSLAVYNSQMNPSDEHDKLLAAMEKLAPKPQGQSNMPG